MRTIRDIMVVQLITLRPDSPLRHALDLMIEHDISAVPVVDEDCGIVGVLTDRNLLALLHQTEAATVQDLMTPDPATVPVEAPLVDVVDQLMASDFRRVLVHDGGKLVGLVTRADLMPAMLEILLQRTHA